MLSDEDLEQVKIQIADDLAGVCADYDAKIENLHNIARFWQAMAVKAIAHVTPIAHDRTALFELLNMLRSPIGSHYVDRYEADNAVNDAGTAIACEGQSPETVAAVATAQDRVDIDALIHDADDLFARTHKTDELQLVMIRRTLNWQLTMTRLFCKMDYVHQGDIRELLNAALIDHRAVPPMDEVIAKTDDVIDALDNLPEAPSGERARDELDRREERAIMLDA